METARQVMQYQYGAHYSYWTDIISQHDLTAPDYPIRLTCARASVMPALFCPIAPFGYASKYERNMCLQLAAVAFPEHYERVVGKPTEKEMAKWTEKSKLLFTKMEIAVTKQLMNNLLTQHKQLVRNLKIMDVRDRLQGSIPKQE